MRKICAFILLFFFYFTCHSQVVITGRVTNASNQPLEAATITIKNKVVTITDSSGQYTFSTNALPVNITISQVGYCAKTIFVNSKNNINSVLLQDDNLMLETVVTAFGNTTKSLKNISAAVSVLNKNALSLFSGQSFVSAINTIPGVKMDERSPGSYRLSIRGNLLRSTFGIRNVKVYWNGLPFTDANGNTYLNEIALSNVDKIEIIKGPSGSMYGTGTGGVVLLTNDFASVSKKYAEINTSIGNYGLFSANASYVKADEKNNTNISISHQQSNGYRTQTNMRRDAENFAWHYQINHKNELNTTVFYSDLYYQTPGALTFAEMQQDPRQARPAAGAFNSAVAQKAAIYLKTFYAGISDKIQLNNKWQNTTGVYFANTKGNNPAIRNYESKIETGTGMRTIFQYAQSIFKINFGGEYQYTFTNTSISGNKLGVKDTLQYHDKINARQFNVFVHTEVKFKNDLIITAGLSYNNFYYGFKRVNQSPLVKLNGNFQPQLIPRLALSKEISAAINIYSSVSKGFSPPSIDEIHASDGKFNVALKAESAVNYEAGIKTELIKNKLWLDATYYFFTLRNTIVSRRDSSGADYYVNAGKTKQYGTEIALNYLPINNNDRLIQQLKLQVNYTNINARFAQYQQGSTKYDGNRLTGTTPDVFEANATIITAKKIYANVAWSYTSKTPVNDANTFFAKSYNLFFTKLGYKKSFHKKTDADFFVSFQHSFNNPYSLGNDLNAAANRYFNPSSPIDFNAGVKLRFNIK
ncbi:MAG: TonB-dependent receptor [Ferruginibacter sp.]